MLLVFAEYTHRLLVSVSESEPHGSHGSSPVVVDSALASVAVVDPAAVVVSSPWALKALAIGGALALTTLNAYSARAGIAFGNGTTVLKVSALLAIIGAGAVVWLGGKGFAGSGFASGSGTYAATPTSPVPPSTQPAPQHNLAMAFYHGRWEWIGGGG